MKISVLRKTILQFLKQGSFSFNKYNPESVDEKTPIPTTNSLTVSNLFKITYKNSIVTTTRNVKGLKKLDKCLKVCEFMLQNKNLTSPNLTRLTQGP